MTLTLLNQKSLILNVHLDIEPENFCTCTNCEKMDTAEECKCCRTIKFMAKKDGCVLDNELVDRILQPEILEINLR